MVRYFCPDDKSLALFSPVRYTHFCPIAVGDFAKKKLDSEANKSLNSARGGSGIPPGSFLLPVGEIPAGGFLCPEQRICVLAREAAKGSKANF